MNKMQDRARLSEKAVQKVAKESTVHKKPRKRAQSRRPRNSRVTISVKVDWRYGLDERIVKQIEALNIPDIDSRIQVISPTEVIITNPKDDK